MSTVLAASASATPLRFSVAYGADRYTTSVMAEGDPTGTAFIVTGEKFPDGLTAGAVAGMLGGNVYLTPKRQLTQEVRERVVYAERIVVVGSEGAVGLDVMTWLQQNTRAQLERVEGLDRYDTAAKLSARFYQPGVERVVVATGEDFPDALAGSAAAAHADSPVLLVRRDALPTETAAELARLRPQAITVVGGEGKVSEAVRQELQRFTAAPVDRLHGADRYETAVAVSRSFFPSAEDVTVVSGEKFPDALPAGAYAGRLDGPLLLAHATCVPETVNLEIERVQLPFEQAQPALQAFGGPSTVSEAALKRTNCQPPGSPRWTYLEDLPAPVGGAKWTVSHATMGGHFYPRSVAYDTDPRNSEYRTWKLGSAFSSFSMVAGVADLNTTGLTSTVEVYGDEKLLASRRVSPGQPARFDLDVRGVDNLKIVTTTPAGAVPGTATDNHVHLGDAAVR
ncbi:cell wall-binding repeat-containing protein [Kineococcus indalonis]|uniref:cell wall-binding repeat-containing protein n=1 Tax=Kineococcus indalonis TaxID=2696566 RepID=UPI001412EF4D|nr:cell wall-binding repeat-containing protein [Kineococcus indalonis]NAZ84608.1 hypothetical protein [Kineococcus indalonis]